MKYLLLLVFLMVQFAVFAVPNGTLCLTFDDRFLDQWIKADEIFKKYDARVTFFISGKIDDQTLAALKRLQDGGHSIGLHALNHAKMPGYIKKHGMTAYTANEIMPQLEICRKNAITIRAFAYPYSQRDPDTDRELFKNFDFLRTNCNAVKSADVTLDKADGCFVRNVQKKQLFYGFPASGNFKLNEVKAAMKRAAEENAVLVFYAHNITEKPGKSHHIAYFQLIQILEYAKELQMRISGMNEL